MMAFWLNIILLYCIIQVQLANATIGIDSNRIDNLMSVPDYMFHCPKPCACDSKTRSVNCEHMNLSRLPDDIAMDTQHLKLGYNNFLTLDNHSFVKVRNLSSLHLDYNNISALTYGTFDGMVMLGSLVLIGNPITKLDDFVFTPLIRLAYLSLKRTQIACMFNSKAFVNLTSLKNLNLQRCRLSEMPVFEYENRPLFPSLLQLDMDFNDFQILDDRSFRGLESLVKLNIKDSHIQNLKDNVFRNMPALETIDLSNNDLINVDVDAFTSRSVKWIILNHSKLTVTMENIDIFRRVPSLESLFMVSWYNNNRRAVKHIFQNLSNLNSLQLNTIDLRLELASNMFANTTKLKKIEMEKVDIDKLNSSFFAGLQNLEDLRLARNRFTTFNEDCLPKEVWKTLKTIKLAGNRFVCDCHIVWFRRWLRTTKVKLIDPLKIQCHSPSDVENFVIKNLSRPTDIECVTAPSDWFLWMVVVSTSLVCAISTVGSVLHRFRWHVRYWYFVYKSKSRHFQELLEQREFQYDAFISYNIHDERWVIHELRPRLEEEDQLRLCLHQRDWLVGRDIVDNVVDSIEQSRKTVVIVSNAFAMSQWCHFELTMAQTRLFEEDRDSLLVVLMEEIDDCNVTPRLRLQMARQTYVEWTDNPVGQQLFWAQLRRALATPCHSVLHADLPARMILDTHN